ncbi:hypothetical protein F5Y10DRAFT_291432 [Nemania abortiva]|nr:hypothetical protein F5Y10DRAFT_291432 [Nemania abortiva]
MVSGAKLWTSLTFAISLVTASPLSSDASSLEKRDSSFLVGYRGVSPGEAQNYMKAGNFLTYETAGGPSHRIDQLGPGAYLSPSPGEWPAPWVCAVQAVSTTQFNLLNKAWVPQTADDGCTPLWDNNGAPNRQAYLTSRGDSAFTTDNTLLFSTIARVDPPKLQLLIPAKLIQAGKVKFAVNCADITDTAAYGAIQALGSVDWYSWAKVKGTPQQI